MTFIEELAERTKSKWPDQGFAGNDQLNANAVQRKGVTSFNTV